MTPASLVTILISVCDTRALHFATIIVHATPALELIRAAFDWTRHFTLRHVFIRLRIANVLHRTTHFVVSTGANLISGHALPRALIPARRVSNLRLHWDTCTWPLTAIVVHAAWAKRFSLVTLYGALWFALRVWINPMTLIWHRAAVWTNTTWTNHRVRAADRGTKRSTSFVARLNLEWHARVR